MLSRGNHGVIAVLSLLAATATNTLVQQADAHPGCKPGTTDLTQANTIFCPTDLDPLYDDGLICCDAVMEADMIVQIDQAALPAGTCADMYQEVRGKGKSGSAHRVGCLLLAKVFQERI